MTIKEVAKKAGVSPSAVSRYMNGGSLSEEKAGRIRAVMEETGFQANAAASSMRTGVGKQIGVITPRIDSESAALILDGVTEQIHGSGYGVLMEVSGDMGLQEAACIESLWSQQAAGIILMGTAMRPDLKKVMQESARPIVVTGQRFEGCSCVYHSDYEAVKELTRRMVGKGRRRIGYIGVFEEDKAFCEDRLRGVQDAWHEACGMAEPLPSVISTGFLPKEGFLAMKELMDLEPRIDGVICASDQLAAGVMIAVLHAGKRIPEDIAVAGVGNSWADSAMAVPLTSVRLPYRECGREAARILMEQIRSPEPLPTQYIQLGYRIIERGSM